jgi:hypothetical protein
VPRTVVTPAPLEKEDAAPAAVPSGFLSPAAHLVASSQVPGIETFLDAPAGVRYRGIFVAPVEVWRSADRLIDDVSEEDLQYLAHALYEAVAAKLGKSFVIEKQAGAGVLELHLALTLVTKAGEPVDFFSSSVPVAFVSRREGGLVAATRRLVRSCAIEAELTDASARGGTVRAAVFDGRRAGSPKEHASTWEDVHAVFERWADMLGANIAPLRAVASGR